MPPKKWNKRADSREQQNKRLKVFTVKRLWGWVSKLV